MILVEELEKASIVNGSWTRYKDREDDYLFQISLGGLWVIFLLPASAT